MIIFLMCFIILHSFICQSELEPIQERATITSYDPKYVVNPQAFTGRVKRGEPYRSNISMTTLHPWGNNVTMTIVYASKRTGNDVLFQMKVCDVYRHRWLEDFVLKYFGMRKTCPFPAGTYRVINLEIPPKNYPFPLPKGEALLYWTLTLTETKHVIFKVSIKIKI